MLILADKPGQLGNSLILYANLWAFAKEHHLRLYNPAFYSYAPYFVFTRGKYSINKWMYRLLHPLARLFRKTGSRLCIALDWQQSLDLDQKAQYHALLHPFRLIMGWKYRGQKLVQAHKSTIKTLFSPAEPYALQLEDFWQKTFIDNQEIILGMHIRRGDYAGFENGIYYYSLEDYKKLIPQLVNLFPKQKLHLLICSNEQIPLSEFSGLGAKISAGPGHELLDMYAFAKCHYLIGPPSTYTMWASFYGEVPLYMLHNIQQPFVLSDFKCVDEL